MSGLLFALRALGRDFKSGELGILLAALLVAVSMLTAVGFLTDRVREAFLYQAAEALAADLRLTSARPLSDDYRRLAAESGLQTADITAFPSVVLAGEASTLAGVHAVSEGYPLRGAVRISDQPYGPARQARDIPGPGEAWARPALLARLDIAVGGRLSVGAHTVEITRVLDYRPDEGFQFLDLAPTLLMNEADVAATQLIQPGSRVTYTLLFAGSPEDISAFARQLRARLEVGEQLRALDALNPQLDNAIVRGENFLNLAALISVLLAAVAVAMSAKRYVARHLDTIALMKCLGARQGLIIRISVLQLLTLALVSGALGSLLGFCAQYLLGGVLAEYVGLTLPPPSLRTVGLGFGVAAAILTGFALPAFMNLRRVPPLRVLRRDLKPPPLRYWASYGIALAVLLLLLWWLVRDPMLLIYVSAGAAVTVVILIGAGWLLVRALAGFRGAAGIAWRYGLANISRRGRDSVILLVAFGVGLMVLLLLSVVRNELLSEWDASLPPQAPNNFLINIQPHDAEPLREFFEERGLNVPRLWPLARARLTHINGTPVAELDHLSSSRFEWQRREANLTWALEPQADNRIVAGRWWTEDPSAREVSVEERMADSLELSLGDTVSFDVAGESVTATVTSLRTVQWDSFRPNFFMVFSPGALEDAPGTFVASVFVPHEQKRLLLELMKLFPSVTVIDMESILTQVREVIDQAALGVESVFVFTLLAGVIVLLAAIQSSREERLYETAMLRTLGASRRVVMLGVAVEFSVLGLLAGLLAAAGASLAGYLLASRIFNLNYTASPWLWFIGIAAGAGLVGISGILATRSVVNHPPVSTLRQGF